MPLCHALVRDFDNQIVAYCGSTERPKLGWRAV